jgi:hypothetical protein
MRQRRMRGERLICFRYRLACSSRRRSDGRSPTRTRYALFGYAKRSSTKVTSLLIMDLRLPSPRHTLLRSERLTTPLPAPTPSPSIPPSKPAKKRTPTISSPTFLSLASSTSSTAFKNTLDLTGRSRRAKREEGSRTGWQGRERSSRTESRVIRLERCVLSFVVELPLSGDDR